PSTNGTDSAASIRNTKTRLTVSEPRNARDARKTPSGSSIATEKRRMSGRGFSFMTRGLIPCVEHRLHTLCVGGQQMDKSAKTERENQRYRHFQGLDVRSVEGKRLGTVSSVGDRTFTIKRG